MKGKVLSIYTALPVCTEIHGNQIALVDVEKFFTKKYQLMEKE